MKLRKTIEDMGKKIYFRAGFTESGDKIIIIVPKKYHNDIRRIGKPIDVTVEEVEK